MKQFQFEIDGVERASRGHRVISGRATASSFRSAIADAAANFGDIKFTKEEAARLRKLSVGEILITALENSGSWHFQVLVERVR